MKIVKLNRRYRAFLNHGHEVGLRFDGYSTEARQAERTAERLRGNQYQNGARWAARFSKSRLAEDPRPFWITFLYPEDLTLVLLAFDPNS